MIDNRDLRLLNIKREDTLFYRHKVFIETIQRAKDVNSAAKKLNMSPVMVSRKLNYLRGAHPVFKNLRRFILSKDEMKELAKIAEKTAPKVTIFDEMMERVVAWNNAKSVKEFAKKFKIAPLTARQWAGQLRRRYKMNLKRFSVRYS